MKTFKQHTQLDEISDKTLTSYLTKVHDDSLKHDKDPTKRSAEKRSKSVMGFSRAFNKLDSRQQKKEVELVEEIINELSKTTLASYEAGARTDADKLMKQGNKAKKPETKYPKYKKATMRYAGAHKARGKIFKKEFMGEDGMGGGAVAAAGPTNTSSGGAVASVGQPPGSKFGEPGVYLNKKKKSDPRMFKQFRRKAPKM